MLYANRQVLPLCVVSHFFCTEQKELNGFCPLFSWNAFVLGNNEKSSAEPFCRFGVTHHDKFYETLVGPYHSNQI